MQKLARLATVAALAIVIAALAFASSRERVCEWNSTAQPNFKCAVEMNSEL